MQVTPVSRRKLKGKLLRSPFAELADVAPLMFSSWVDEFLPNSIWLAIVASSVDQRAYIELLRQISTRIGETFYEKTFLPTHNFLSRITKEEFEYILEPLSSNARVMADLTALLLIDSLPDRENWILFLTARTDAQPNPQVIARAIASCIDHQSQIATDVRWFKVASFISVNKLRVPYDRLVLLSKYPEPSEYPITRPFIRAIEMTLRNVESGVEKPENVIGPNSKEFWFEMLKKSPCVTHQHTSENGQHVQPGLHEHLIDVKNALAEHFFNSITGTAIDPRMDSAFGLCLFSLKIAIEVSLSPEELNLLSRMALRSVVESFITLRYLSVKDDSAIWMQYRNYGSGQTALAFLKNSVGLNPPDFIDLSKLEALANEDAWLETKDIAIGNWANLNLRRMSEEADVKPVYDSFYDWSSGFVHGHWGVVRDTCFVTCLNPLHRLHRVPSSVPAPPPVIIDMCKLVNRCLDELNSLYPAFKRRIKWKEFSKVQ